MCFLKTTVFQELKQQPLKITFFNKYISHDILIYLYICLPLLSIIKSYIFDHSINITQITEYTSSCSNEFAYIISACSLLTLPGGRSRFSQARDRCIATRLMAAVWNPWVAPVRPLLRCGLLPGRHCFPEIRWRKPVSGTNCQTRSKLQPAAVHQQRYFLLTCSTLFFGRLYSGILYSACGGKWAGVYGKDIRNVHWGW